MIKFLYNFIFLNLLGAGVGIALTAGFPERVAVTVTTEKPVAFKTNADRSVDAAKPALGNCWIVGLLDCLIDGPQTALSRHDEQATATAVLSPRALARVEANGGVESETRKIAALAADFRAKIAALPFKIVSNRMSNAVTPLQPTGGKLNAYEIFLKLKDEYGIWICPNGGELKEKLFRVGHVGALTSADNDALIAALTGLQRKNMI